MSTVTGVNLTRAARGRHSGGDGMEERGVRAFPWTEIRSAPVTDRTRGATLPTPTADDPRVIGVYPRDLNRSPLSSAPGGPL
jgi:hypothetical protein